MKDFDPRDFDWLPEADELYAPKTDRQKTAREHNINALMRTTFATVNDLEDTINPMLSPAFWFYAGARAMADDFAFMGMQIVLTKKESIGVEGEELCLAVCVGTSDTDEWIYTDFSDVIIDFTEVFTDEPERYEDIVPTLRRWADLLEEIARQEREC